MATCFCGWAVHAVYWSPYTTRANVPIDQPIPFSHQHHVGGLGIDCRYCHTSVETSAFAGLPSTETCMTCHSQLFTEAPVLSPLWRSLANNTPIRWNRVNSLPDFVFFNHGIHLNSGIGCSTCHGRMDQMPLTWRSGTLYMRWCLECHTDPAPNVRPRSAVFDQAWKPAPDGRAAGSRLLSEYHVNTAQLTDCAICHR
jgi:hypothetical protein